MYEGEYNAAGEREGYGTMRAADGDVVYEEGRGTFRYAEVYEGE